MSDDGDYRVAIKPSAWRASAAAGEWVNRNGAARTFPSKAVASEWARECAGPDHRVWIQDAVPWDRADVDGYLVAASDRDPAVEREAVPGDQRRLDGADR